jgi:hypothetical protein
MRTMRNWAEKIWAAGVRGEAGIRKALRFRFGRRRAGKKEGEGGSGSSVEGGGGGLAG